MPKTPFNRPQKILIGCSIFVFIAVSAVIGLLVYSYWQYNYNRPIQVSAQSEYPQDAEGNKLQNGILWGQEFKQVSGEALLSWPQGQLLIIAPAMGSIKQTGVSITEGIVYLQLNGEQNISFGGQDLKLTDVTAVYDAGLKALIILADQNQVSDSQTAKVGQQVLFDGSTFVVQAWDRSVLSGETWQTVLAALAKYNLLPESLADITPPSLSDISPVASTQVEANTLELNATVEPGAIVQVNGTAVTVDAEGKFSTMLTLEVGVNTVSILLQDKWGNKQTVEFSYTRQDPVIAVSCDTGSFNTQLLCLINRHRFQNGLANLTAVAALDQAALGHSQWMEQNGQFSHTGEGGSAPWDRCAAAGAACSAENIALQSSVSAQGIFDLWKNSESHNQNMLGNFSQIGIGLSGTYITAVFN